MAECQGHEELIAVCDTQQYQAWTKQLGIFVLYSVKGRARTHRPRTQQCILEHAWSQSSQSKAC